MDGLNPTLAMALGIRRTLESGGGPREAVSTLIEEFRGSPIGTTLIRWKYLTDRGLETGVLVQAEKSPHRRALFFLLERSLKGESILPALADLEQEIIEACEADIDAHLARLPFILLVPLLFLLFPAVMILILGPFVDILMTELGP